MRIGLLVTGDVSVRAAHSLASHDGVDEVVVLGPATSKSFEVVKTAAGCDFLVGSGPSAIEQARKHAVPLIWDGNVAQDGAAVWGASPTGLALAMAAREPDPRLVAVAHPDLSVDTFDRTTRFPDPVGRVGVRETQLDGRPVAEAHSPNEFAACLAVGVNRRVTVVDHGHFLSGVALAAGIAVANGGGTAVWEKALPYLETATEMGLVMAESD